MSRIAVVLNGKAGSARAAQLDDRVRDAFAAAQLDAHLYIADETQPPDQMAREALRSGPEILVAGGGDGTVSCVAAKAAEAGVPLGVLPLGTLNHFARDLAIPADIEAAVEVIKAGHTTAVDVGEVNGRPFINNSSLGLYAYMVTRRQLHERLGSGKWTGMLRGLLWVLERYPFHHVTLLVDGKQVRRLTPFVFIGNNTYQMEGLAFGTRASLSEGHLSLCVAHRTGRLGLLRLVLRAMVGTLREAKDFDVVKALHIVVEPHSPAIRVALDGEVELMRTPIEYRSVPGRLRVFVPRPEEAQSA